MNPTRQDRHFNRPCGAMLRGQLPDIVLTVTPKARHAVQY